jgi:pilus assembly protein Flp/PilA
MVKKILKKFLLYEKGQGLIEYALILVLVAIVVISILLLLGPTVGNVFSNIVANLQRVGIGGGQTIVFNGTPSVTKSGGAGCTYTASASVTVTQNGQPAQGVSVGGTVTLINGGGATVGSFSIGGTTNSSGQASLSGTTSGSCSGAQATVSISGGPSATVLTP